VKNQLHEIHNNSFVKMVLESIGDGVFTLDAEGRIISWNPAMEQISGYRAEEAMGKGCRILSFDNCFGSDCPGDINACGIFRRGRIEPTECTLRHRDGHAVPVIKNARVVKTDHGGIVGIVESVTDLTELNHIKLKMRQAARSTADSNRFEQILGKSHVMQTVFWSIRASADSDTTILIQGESGTGKELVASAIHARSKRRDNPLVTVNCSALPESLLESELFGHAKGAFTGAVRDHVGRFEKADGGTIFLDEIGDISPFTQLKLLRVLQFHEIERVGGSGKRRIDIRIIAATNKDLRKKVQAEQFREDLYYRLKVFPIYLPPLRKRKEDIPLLVDHFIRINNELTGKRIQGVLPPVMRIFMDYPWPGNVRELRNAVEHAFVLCEHDAIAVSDMPVEIRHSEYNSAGFEARPAPPGEHSGRGHLDREGLLGLLEACDWNKAEAARRVGVSRAAIWKYMKKWNIPMQKGL